MTGVQTCALPILHVSLRRKTPIAAVVGYSGRVIAPELLGRELVSKAPVLLVHGDADAVVPFISMRFGEEALAGEGIEVKAIQRPGLGHGIDDEGLEAGIDFVARAFGA